MSHNVIEKQALQKITPNKEYDTNLHQIIKELEGKLLGEIQKRKLPANVQLVGSMAKDTYLKDNLDIDFFLCYPTSHSKEKIAKNTLEIGKKLLKDTEESYAEHPYIRGIFKGFKAEIVPCYQIEDASQKLSAVDRTPLHTKYVRENITTSQKSDIRLFKQFLRGIGCYGAEAEIEGFSGYLCEILVIKYGSFKDLIEQAQKWRTGKKLAIAEGDYPSFNTPLTFIDPVDPDRNVSSALSKDKFDLFIKACKEYQKKPTINFFFPNPIEPWPLDRVKLEMERNKSYFIGVSFSKPDIIDENLYPQIRKTVKSLEDNLNRNDFEIKDAEFHVGKKSIYIVINTTDKPLSETMIHMGPPAKLKTNVKNFISKWENNKKVVKGPYKQNNRYYVEIERQYRYIKDYLKKEFNNLSMGKSIERSVKTNYEILNLEDLLIDDLRIFWTEYLDKKMSWER